MPLFLSTFSAGRSNGPHRPNSSTTVGVVSIVIGGATLAVAWIPYLGMLAIPIAIAGAVVGFVGLIIGRAAGQRFVPWPFVGVMVCGLSMATSLLSTTLWQNRTGAPGRSPTIPSPPAIDMRHTTGQPFAPPPMTTQPTFVMPKIDRPGVERPAGD